MDTCPHKWRKMDERLRIDNGMRWFTSPIYRWIILLVCDECGEIRKEEL